MPSENTTELYVLYRDDWPAAPLFEIYESAGARYWLVQLPDLIHEEQFTADWTVAEIAQHFIRYWFEPVRLASLTDCRYDPPRIDERSENDQRELQRIKSDLETAVLAEQKELFA